MIVLAFFGSNIFIAKLHDDSLIYFAQSQLLASSGSTQGLSYGDGLAPVTFAPIAAYVRLPIFLFLRDFNAIVRVIQVQNVILLICVALLSWRYLVLRLPTDAAPFWRFAPFFMVATCYTPWFSNAYLPLSDNIFAALTMAFIVLCLEYDRWMRSWPLQLLWGVLIIAILTIASIQKGTAMAMLAYLAVFMTSRHRFSWRQSLAGLGTILLFVAIMVWSESRLYGYYASIALTHSIDNRPLGLLIGNSLFNFFASALPAQIVPNFNFTFMNRSDLTLGLLLTDFQATWAPFVLLGFTISALILLGAWKGRRFLAPELTLILLTAPLYALIVNGGGTIRYLAFVQPVYLLLFVTGLRTVRLQIPSEWVVKPRAIMFSVAAIALIGVAGVSTSIMAAPMQRIFSMRGFLSDLDRAFGAERRIVASLANDRTRFVNIVEGNARWNAVAHVRYAAPGLVPELLCRGHEVYWVFDCDRRNCSAAKMLAKKSMDELDRLGSIRLNTIYTDHSSAAEITIRRVTAVQPNNSCK